MLATHADSEHGPGVTQVKESPTRSILTDYDTRWPLMYAEERDRILDAIGDKVVAIEHVGSTSIPGSRAKPVIDILVGIRNLQNVESCIGPLRRIGYEYRAVNRELIPNTEYFRKGSPGVNTHHIRMVEAGGGLWLEYILFRDYLRTHREEVLRYERLKVEAYDKHGRYLPLEAKRDFISSIVSRARSEMNLSAK